MQALNPSQEQVIHDSVNVIAGTSCIERGKRFNSAIARLTIGKRYIHQKINLTSSETVYFESGTSSLTFPVKDITFGVLICWDQNDALPARTYKTRGVDALVILAAHFYEPREAIQKLDKNRALPIARAVENGLFVLKVNAVGSENGKTSCGDSLLVDPIGFVIQEAVHRTETILSCKLD